MPGPLRTGGHGGAISTPASLESSTTAHRLGLVYGVQPSLGQAASPIHVLPQSALDVIAAERRVLVTGGAGFIGASLAVGLAKRHPQWEVFALDNLRRRGSELNLPRLRAAGVDFR